MAGPAHDGLDAGVDRGQIEAIDELPDHAGDVVRGEGLVERAFVQAHLVSFGTLVPGSGCCHNPVVAQPGPTIK